MKIKSKRTALALLAVMAVHPLANSQNLSDQEVARIVSSGRYFPAARDFSLREKADTMEMRILYGFEYVIDTLSGKCLHEPYMLEIGGKLTHYYSYNAYIRDSVQSEVYASEKSKGMNAFTDITSSVIPEDQTATYYEIFRCIPSSSRYVLLRVQNNDYCYSEKAEQTEWRLSDRTDTVCGYRCQVAEGQLNGRQWTVSFSTDIPYPYGPWKLEGLPGLILKAEDSEGLLRWEAVGLEKGRGRSIYRYTENKTSAIGLHYRCEKTSKKNIAELWRMIWRAPGFLRTSGKPMTVMLPDGSIKTVGVQNHHEGYYPPLE